jgi:hypothetical protein
MSLDPKHDIYSLRDTFQGLRTYFQGVLSEVMAADQVMLAFRDERGDLEENRKFPSATIYLYDVQIANNRRYGGRTREVTMNAEQTQADISKSPIPVDLFFQLDTYCDKEADDWSVMEKLVPVFGARGSKVVTPEGREFYLVIQTIDKLDDLTGDALWRTAGRFKLQVWFAHPEAAQQSYLVLQRRLTMEGETWTMDDPPE